MTAIKICGVTREEDAAAAVSLGADFLGFILWPGSPRAVEIGVAADIIRRVPKSVETVAVLVSPSATELGDVEAAGFTIAQVHKQVPVALPPRIRIMRAVRLADGGDGIEPDVPIDETVLLDTHDPVRHGGTGRTIDWQRARAIAARRRIFLAGGLTPENVGEAIRTVHPYAVDVASGVEDTPGIKDHDKLKAFIHAVKETA
jgi:phosphoribosylanthranilate isomerase